MSSQRFRSFAILATSIKHAAGYLGLILFLLAIGLRAAAQMQLVPGVTTVAGNGTAGYSGDGGPATSGELNRTEGVATDSAGNLYIADWQNNRVRKVDAGTGVITTVAGNGTAGFSGDGAAATSATLKGPTGVVVDSAGNLYIADQANNRVRKVDAGTGVITTVAGNGTAGFSGDGGLATNAAMFSPTDLTFDSAGNLYISDNANSRIRKVAVGTGVITTYAGNGTAGFAGDGGAATSAALNAPAGIVIDSAGNLYIADVSNNRIRKVAAGTGVITTYAGNGTAGFAGDGGAATSAQFNTPARVALDKVGNLFIADQGNNRVREVFLGTGIITTVAGNGTAGFSGDGGPGTAAAFDAPLGIAIDNAGSLYISDFYNNRIRKLAITANNFPATTIGASSVVQNILLQTTAAETITSITVPQSQGGKQEYSIGTITGCAIGGSNVAGTVCTIPITFTPAYPGRRWIPIQVVTSTGNINFGLTGIGIGPLAALAPGIITTVAGNGTSGYAGDGGAATSAQINAVYRQTFDSAGNMYIAEYGNNRVRKVAAATGIITTVAGTGTAGYSGDGGLATSAKINGPQGVAVDSAGNLYIADSANSRVRKVTAATGMITTVAGTGTQGYSGDGGPATSAGLVFPTDVAVDSAGNLYIADYNGCRIRKVAAGTGIITTVAGTGTLGYSGDGGPATSAMLSDPMALAVDSADNLYIADQFNNRARKVTVATGVITTVAGNGTAGFSGDNGPATSAELNKLAGIAVDPAGNLYIGDQFNRRVRKVDAGTGVVTTFAGTGTQGYTGDGGAATSAQTSGPVGTTLDSVGNLYLSDFGNSRIRKVDISQSALTYPTATTVGTSDSTDNPQTAIVSNIGNASLTIPPPSSGNNPSVAANFTFDSSSTCSQLSSSSSAQTLTAGANCTIAIDFVPIQAGAITGSSVLTDTSLNAAAATQTIHLTATGVAANTTTTVSSSINPSAYTQPVTFTATVAPTVGTALPTGTVQFSVDGTAVGGPVALNGSGVATFASSTLSVGTHSITAVYTPDSTNFTGSSATALSQTVTKGTLGQNGLANITLVSSPNPSAFSQAVLFTATVPSGVTGTVQFVDGATVLGTGTISGTTATYTTSTLAVGTHPMTAVYSGDTNFNSATSAVDNQVVTTVSTSTTTLSVAPSTVRYGDPATLTAVVAPSFATGTVSFYEGTTLLGTASLDNTGTAVLPISTLNAGVHTIVAQYNGDPIVPPSTSNTAQLTVTQRTAPGGGPAITVTVNDATRTTTQSNPPFTYSPSGQLFNGDTYATAIGGTPTYSTAAGSTPGTYSVTVSGLTSANYTIAFVPGNLTVTISPSSTTLVAGPSSPQYGDPVTLTATVTSGASGTVSFYDGSVLLGTGTVSNGVATLTTTTLVAGTHSITATYNGDATYASSQSAPATVTVAKKTAPGGGAALTITVQDASRPYGTADPQFNYVVTGTLVNGDTYATAITGAPAYSAADTPTSSAGSTFPISVSGLSSANYEIVLVNGTLTIVSASTTTTLTTSTNSAQYGDPITLTATVAPSGATGTVVFMNGSTVLGTGTVSGGVATLTTTMLSAGTYTITSSYQGDANYGASTSGPVSITVNPRTAPGGGAALIVTASDASRAYGQGNPAFSYTVTGTLVNGDTYATAVTGVPVYSTSGTSTSPAGTYPISIAGGLNSSNYVIAFANGTLIVTQATLGQNGLANITLDSSPNPSTYQQAVTFTAAVPNGVTGTVQFVDGTTVLGTGTISGTTATFTTNTLAVGTHPVTAVYSGDANYNPATSAVDNQVVTKATLGQNGLADITLVSSPNPSTYGQPVIFTATVPSGVTGTVQFVDGTTVLGTGTISGTTATFTTNTLAVGTHPVTAVYSGDANYNPATSAVDNQLVTTVSSASTTLSVAPSTVMYGDPATLTAVVLPSFATGTVSFYEGSTLLGTASLDNTGTAVLPISTLNAGVHNIMARYNGDSNVAANTSNTAQLTVTQRTASGGGPAITVTVNDAARTATQSNPPFTYSAAGQLVNGDTYATAISGTPVYSTAGGSTPGTYSITVSGLTLANYTIAFVPGNLTVTISPSTTTLAAGPASPQYGDPVALTATVTSGATGTVSFYDGSVLLGNGTVSNGVATLTTATLVAGAHTVTAVYNGDATYASSQSGPATVTVSKKTGPSGGAALTITVQNESRQYNTADPQFSYVITGTLVNVDTHATAVTGVPAYSAADTPTSPAGSTFPISVSGLSSANYEIAVVPGTLAIVTAPTATTLATSTNSAQYGDPVTLTATVAPSGATGTELFMQGATVLGTGTVSGGVATLTTTTLHAGAYTITSSYQGDTNYAASTSGPITLTINRRSGPGGTAALTVTVGDASRPYGQGNPAFSYTVAGTLVNGDTYAAAITGVPVYSTAGMPTSPAGTYPISVAGLNSSNYVIAFVNGTLTVTIPVGGTSLPVVAVGPTTPIAGQPVTLTASVPTTGTTVPTGTVTFYYNGNPIGTGTLNASGVATLTTSTLPVGTGTITIGYGGDSHYASSTSLPVPMTVAAAPGLDFTLTLTSAQIQTVISGQAAPYTVRVAPTNSAYPGVVTFTATGLPPGATVTFSPATVAANGGPAPVNLSIQTASIVGLNKLERNATSIALGLLLLPLAGARRMRRSGRTAGRYIFMMLVLFAGIAATAGLTGCGSHNGFFGHAPQTYNITITATSGNIQHSVNATLNVQ
jgi:hypothetical protein